MAENVDLTRIVLTDAEQRVFDKFAGQGTAVLSEEEYSTLRKTKLVDPSLGWFQEVKWPCSVKLTELGLQLQAYQKQLRRAVAKDDRRFRIHTILTIIAIGLSAISIVVDILLAADLSRVKRWIGISTAPTASPAATMAVTETVSSADPSKECSAESKEPESPAQSELQAATAAAP